MTICPLCNGLRQMSIPCKRCHASLQDQGKVTDYLDEYSAYEEIETLKQVDGVLQSIESQICIHLYYCNQCDLEEYVIIQE